MMQAVSLGLAASALILLASCAPSPPVTQSREVLWERFGGQPVDAVLMAWGTPERETRMTDGSRLVTYKHSTVFDADSPYEYDTSCEVTFMAQSPKYRIDNIAMDGTPYECHLLAQGHTGTARHVRMPSTGSYRPYPYRYPF